MANLGKLIVALGIDKKEYSEGLQGASSDAEGFGSKVTGALGGIGKIALGVGVAGFAAVAGGIYSAISSASEAQQVFAQTESVIKATGGSAGKSAQQMADLASSLSSASGKSRFGDEAILQGENLLATFTNIKGASFDLATGAMVDLAQAMGTDVKGGAIQLGKALNDPTAGISALSRVGVSFTDKQKAVIKSLQDTGDMAGAQKVILDELNKEFGGSAAAAAGTFAGKMDTLKDKFGELLESAGTKLLPFISSFVDTLNSDAVQGAISGFVDLISNGIGTAITIVGPIINSVGTIIGDLASYFQAVSEDGDTMNDFLSNLPGFLQPIVLFIASQLIPAITDFATWIGTNVPIALGIVSDFLTTTVIPAISTLVNWFIVNLPGAISSVVGFFNSTLLPIFQSFADLILNHVIPALIPLAQWFIAQLPSAISIAIDIWNNVLKPAIMWLSNFIATVLLPTIGNLVDWLAKNLPVAIASATQFFNTYLLPIIQKVIAFIIDPVIPTMGDLANWLAKNIPVAIQKASDFFNNVLVPAATAVFNYITANILPVVKSVYDWFLTSVPTAVQKVSDFFNNTLVPAFRAVYDFVNTNIIPIIDKLTNIALALLQQESDKASKLWNTVLLPAFTGVYNFVNTYIVPIFNTVNEKLGLVQTASNDLVSKALSPLSNFFNDVLKLALQGASGWVNDLISSFNDTVSAIRTTLDWVQKLIDKFNTVKTPDALQQQSPSEIEQSILDVGSALRSAANATTDFNQGLNGARTPATAQTNNSASTVINIDARGAQVGVEEKIRQVVNQVLQANVNSANLAIRLNNF